MRGMRGYIFWLSALTVVLSQRPPCNSDACFDAMAALNYANFSTIGFAGDSDCFSLVTSDRSISGVRCSFIHYTLSLSTTDMVSFNLTATNDFKPDIILGGCTSPVEATGPQFTASCGTGATSYALNMFMQVSTVSAQGAVGHVHKQAPP